MSDVPGGSGPRSEPFLSVRDLRVHFDTADGVVRAVDGLSFDVGRGRTLGIVGESGSGKSVTNLAIMGLHDRARTTLAGEIVLDGKELLTARERELEKLRGSRMATIFQDARASLSPFHTVGKQIAETYAKHTGASRRQSRARAVEMLGRVGIPRPALRADDYPHQLSGGVCQRVVIAMALVCDPELLLADEPTTALDVTVQAQIMDLLGDLQQELGTSIVFTTHDLGVASRMADDILVMYAGRAVERGTRREVLGTPQHPYTWGLLGSIPTLSTPVGVPLSSIPGAPPSPLDPPPGCRFEPRCAFAEQVPAGRCASRRPHLPRTDVPGAACHLTSAQRAEYHADYLAAEVY